MALADTARLIASLELQDKFSPGLGKAGASLNRFETNLSHINRGVGQVGAGVGRVATNLVKLGAVGVTALAGFIGVNLRAGLQSLKDTELAVAQTNAVLKSTQGISGQTADGIRNLSESLEGLNATIDDKVIQSGANMLLTFTNIRGQAFEPALKTLLDMNQALGGGSEGLTKTAIQLGKALNDPIHGLTALRRVGVTFTTQQQKQIEALQKSGKLFEAQQVILKELATEFGGSFAAAGNTAAGRMAHLKDTTEDLQKAFAGPFVSVLDRITGKLGDFLGEASTLSAVERLGESIAGLFTDEAIDRGIGILRSGLDLLSPANLAKVGDSVKDAFAFVKGLDFETIGKGLEITGRVAKTAIDAFLSLPKEAQAVVIGALAANKLSGGLIGSGIGNIAKGIGGLLTGGGILGRGSSPANPVFVSAIGGVGGGVPAVVGGGLLGALSLLLPAAGLGALAVNQANNIAPAKAAGNPLPAPGFNLFDPFQSSKTLAVTDLSTSALLREGLPALKSEFSKSRATSAELLSLQRSEQSIRNANSVAQLQKLSAQTVSLQQIAAKPNPSVSVAVNVNTNISVSNLERTLISNRIAGSGTIGGFTASAF